MNTLEAVGHGAGVASSTEGELGLGYSLVVTHWLLLPLLSALMFPLWQIQEGGDDGVLPRMSNLPAVRPAFKENDG